MTVLLEVKARFDEENNIRWGKLLEKAGCRVIYGVPSVKTHSKITLVARREGDGVRRYMHLGTGNYNDVTARQYTDMGLLTCDPVLGEDAAAFFNLITGFSRNPRMEKMVYAPKMLRSSLLSLIRTETENARAGLPCGISAKMNSLVDPEIIDVLYDASCAGVPVLLIVRGICCLRPGVPGLSQQIRVRSIVGRFLEHSRVFRFENGGDPRLYLSSADWMPRNLNRRLELMFPVEDAGARAQVEHVLDMQWKDEAKAWEMGPDGEYARVPRGAPSRSMPRRRCFRRKPQRIDPVFGAVGKRTGRLAKNSVLFPSCIACGPYDTMLSVVILVTLPKEAGAWSSCSAIFCKSPGSRWSCGVLAAC